MQRIRQATRVHVLVLRTWSAVFFAVGILFLVVPGRLAAALTGLGRLLGLTGRIEAHAGDLFWVLGLSLMACITLLARDLAGSPGAAGRYRALLAAKLTSTAFFLVLALGGNTVWTLCAVADAFVAATIAWTRPGPGLPGPARRAFARAWPGWGPFFEEWFAFVGLPGGGTLWLRYHLVDGRSREATVQAVVFERDDVRTHEARAPLDDLAGDGRPLLPRIADAERFRSRVTVFHLGEMHLDAANALGRLPDLEWDLAYEAGTPVEHVPSLLAGTGVAPLRYASWPFGVRFRGRVRRGEEVVELDGSPGMVGHLRGRGRAAAWVWVLCPTFDDAPDCGFEGLASWIRVGRWRWGPLSTFALRLDGVLHRFRVSGWSGRAGPGAGPGGPEEGPDLDAGSWSFRGRTRTLVLAGEATFTPGGIELDGDDPDGIPVHTRTTPHARLRLTIEGPGVSGRRELRSTAGAFMETGSRTGPP